MDAASTAQCQDQIVSTVAQSVTQPWDRILVNIEIVAVDGEQTENCLMLSFAQRDSDWVRTSEQLPFPCYDLFVALRDLDTSTVGGAADVIQSM